MAQRRFVPIIGLLIFLCVLGFVYDKLSWTIPINSDNASIVLESLSMLHGNFLLHGWNMGPDTYYLSEMPFFALALLLQSPISVTHNVPAFFLALLVVSLLALVGYSVARQTWDLLAMVILAVLILVPGQPMDPWILLGPYHIMTIFFVVVAVGMLSLLLDCTTRSKIWTYSLVATCALTIALVSDPFALWIGVAPIVIVLLLDFLTSREHISLLVIPLASVLSAHLVQYLLSRAGGFVAAPLGMQFASWSEFLNNIGLFVQTILVLFQANFLGLPLDRATLGPLIRSVGVVIVGWSVWLWARNEFRRTGRAENWDFLDRFLGVSVLLVSISFVVSTEPLGLQTVRYLVPAMFFSCALAARTIARYVRPHLAHMPNRWGIFALACVLYVLAIGPVGGPVAAQNGLAAYLEAHHLYRGYGSYWDANIVTLDSLGRVRVAPVLAAGPGGTIIPFLWNSTNTWYQQGASFLVFDTSNWGQVNTVTAVRTWGPPARTYTYQQYTVLVWKKNLRSTNLAQGNLAQFAALLKAARGYVATSKPLAQLSPLTAEQIGLLSSAYGGYPRSNPAWNWTQEGGWLGAMGTNQIAVGVQGTWPEVQLVVRQYGRYAVHIYFPFPSDLKSPVGQHLQGQLLMVFMSASLPG